MASNEMTAVNNQNMQYNGNNSLPLSSLLAQLKAQSNQNSNPAIQALLVQAQQAQQAAAEQQKQAQQAQQAQQQKASAMATLETYRQNGQFIDLTVTIEQEPFKCHKIVLMRNSEFFKQHFEAKGPSEASAAAAVITLPDHIGKDNFKILLEHFYTNNLERQLNVLNVKNVMVAAAQLKVPEAVSICARYYQENLALINSLNLQASTPPPAPKPVVAAAAASNNGNLTGILTTILAMKEQQSRTDSSCRSSLPKTESLNISDSGKLPIFVRFVLPRRGLPPAGLQSSRDSIIAEKFSQARNAAPQVQRIAKRETKTMLSPFWYSLGEFSEQLSVIFCKNSCR